MIQVSDAIEPRPAARHFCRMLEAARPRFILVNVDEANHTARGLLESRQGSAFRCMLSYEETKCLVQVTVKLKAPTTLSPAQRSIMDQIQASSALARFDPDPEHHQLMLRACSLCILPRDLGVVVRQLIKDIRRILSDDRLTAI